MISRRSILAALALIPGVKLLGLRAPSAANITPRHAVLTTEGYVEAAKLRPGMRLVTLLGAPRSPVEVQVLRQFSPDFDGIRQDLTPISASIDTPGATQIEARTSEINDLGFAPRPAHSLKKWRGGED